MRIPTIHLNGTSRESLLEQVVDAASALQDALRKLDELTPNGRDYYPQGPDALGDAQKEHRARIEKVRSVMVELQEMAEAIADG